MPVDRFYDYLEYVKAHGPIGVGDYLEAIKEDTPMAWSQLLFDLRDTWKAGKLNKVITSNGSAAFVPPDLGGKPYETSRYANQRT